MKERKSNYDRIIEHIKPEYIDEIRLRIRVAFNPRFKFTAKQIKESILRILLDYMDIDFLLRENLAINLKKWVEFINCDLIVAGSTKDEYGQFKIPKQERKTLNKTRQSLFRIKPRIGQDE